MSLGYGGGGYGGALGRPKIEEPGLGRQFAEALDKVIWRCEGLRNSAQSAMKSGDQQRSATVKLKKKLADNIKAHESAKKALMRELEAAESDLTRAKEETHREETEATRARMDLEKATEGLASLRKTAEKYKVQLDGEATTYPGERRGSGGPGEVRSASKSTDGRELAGSGIGRSVPSRPTSGMGAAQGRMGLDAEDRIGGGSGVASGFPPSAGPGSVIGSAAGGGRAPSTSGASGFGGMGLGMDFSDDEFSDILG